MVASFARYSIFGHGFRIWSATFLAGVFIAGLFCAPTASAQGMIQPSSSDFFRGSNPGQPNTNTYNQPIPFSPIPNFSPNSGQPTQPVPPNPAGLPRPFSQQNQPSQPTQPGQSSPGSPTTGATPENQPSSGPGAASEFPVLDPALLTNIRQGGRGTLTPEGYPLVPNKEDYNFKIGPALFRGGVGLRTELTDNLFDSTSNRQGDLITTASIYLRGHWAISSINDLTLNLGIGYNSYLNHPELNSFSKTVELTPGTNLAFKMKVGDFYFRVYDLPSLGQSGGLNFDSTYASNSNSLTLPSGVLFSTFNNDFGLSVLWDLNQVQVQGGYDRQDYIPFGATSESGSPNSAQDQLNTQIVNGQCHSVDSIFASVTVRLTDITSVGLQGTASLITYHGGIQNNGVSYYVGANLGTQLTHYTSLRLSAGYQEMNFSSGGLNNDNSNSSGPYAGVALNHHLNRYISDSLSITHEAILGTTTNSTETTAISENVIWSVSQKLVINLGASYVFGTESGPDGQSIRLFQLSASTGWSLSRKLRMDVYYAFTRRSGGGNGNETPTTLNPFEATSATNYYENQIGLNFSYAF